jgi:hypothetical protein
MPGGASLLNSGGMADCGGGLTVPVVVTCLMAASGGLIFGYDIGISGKPPLLASPAVLFGMCLLFSWIERHTSARISSVRRFSGFNAFCEGRLEARFLVAMLRNKSKLLTRTNVSLRQHHTPYCLLWLCLFQLASFSLFHVPVPKISRSRFSFNPW